MLAEPCIVPSSIAIIIMINANNPEPPHPLSRISKFATLVRPNFPTEVKDGLRAVWKSLESLESSRSSDERNGWTVRSGSKARGLRSIDN
jgi:hypothetical protein